MGPQHRDSLTAGCRRMTSGVPCLEWEKAEQMRGISPKHLNCFTSERSKTGRYKIRSGAVAQKKGQVTAGILSPWLPVEFQSYLLGL